MPEVNRLISADTAIATIGSLDILAEMENVEVEITLPLVDVTAIKDTAGERWRYAHGTSFRAGRFRAEKMKAVKGTLPTVFPHLIGAPVSVSFKEAATGNTFSGNVMIQTYRTGSGTRAAKQVENIEGVFDGGITITLG